MALKTILIILILSTTFNYTNAADYTRDSENTPNPFPTAATYTAHLVTTSRSRLCPQCTFSGKHYYNADPNKQYGHVQWFYGATNDTTKSTYINFDDIFMGKKQKMF